MTLDRDKNFLCNLNKNILFCNRVIKSKRTIKTKLPLQFCIIVLTIMIGQLGLVCLKDGKKACKQTNKQTTIDILLTNYHLFEDFLKGSYF